MIGFLAALSLVAPLYLGGQPATVSWNAIETPINIPCVSASPVRVWGNYIPLIDGHQNRILVRFEQGSSVISYQFKNTYNEPAFFDITFKKNSGLETASLTLQPGAESATGGSFLYCSQLLSVKLTHIRVGGAENPTDSGNSPNTISYPPNGDNRPPSSELGSDVATTGSCQGRECLSIIAVRKGTRCGTPDSVEVDIRNDSSEFLRGYVKFETSAPSPAQPTDILKPGEIRRGEHWVCHGTGAVYRISNIGPTDKETTYPKRPAGW
jgi:hypothetical protein